MTSEFFRWEGSKFMEKMHKPNSFQEATCYLYQMYLYLLPVNRQGCFDHAILNSLNNLQFLLPENFGFSCKKVVMWGSEG